MSKFILFLVTVALVSCAAHGIIYAPKEQPTNVAAYAKDVKWYKLSVGRRVALEKMMPMLVDFAVPEGCSRCEFLENNVYNRPEIVEKIHSDFIPIWIDLSSPLTAEEKKFGELFDYKNECLLLFLDHKGNVIKDPEGKKLCFIDRVPPEEFIDYLDYVKTMYIP